MKTHKKIHLIILFMLSGILLQAQTIFIEQQNYFGFETIVQYNYSRATGLVGFNYGIGFDWNALQLKSGFIISPYEKLIPIIIEVNTFSYEEGKVYILVGKLWALNDDIFKQSMMFGFGTAIIKGDFYFKFGIIGIQTNTFFLGLNFSISYNLDLYHDSESLIRKKYITTER